MGFDNVNKGAATRAPEAEHEPLSLLAVQFEESPERLKTIRSLPVGHPAVGAGSRYSDIIRDRFKDDIRFHLGPLVSLEELVGHASVATDVPTAAVPAVAEKNIGASPEFAQRMRAEMDGLPAGVRKLLADNGMTLLVTDEMVDGAPDLKDQHPRGWPPGSTFANEDGAFRPDKRFIMVAETFQTTDGKDELSDRSEGVMRHETGHAVDAALDNYSQTAEFKAAYDKDVAAMPADVKQTLEYLLQPDGAGQQETFAEVFAALNGGSANAAQTGLILKSFPNVSALMQRKLASL